ncbi:MCR_0457 family protein [Acinetobacter nectaris]|uniref:DUF7944 domain-containing protein n=1 Tax=Acinetobacter nectaris CIP 110549 TaxID=1392540 RepID=V2TXD2_9GAMM|nr:hypothetical protein [Acinetobacter nectaris]ESK40325.1 hypothetical protein P256_00772 [Acinetobacter nectaris CIP 110549]MCF9034361.1 hypothetical protein [Acinetobacter nectaris]MCF9046673.1 hypothetical protein [Acinetobacter nectaris]
MITSHVSKRLITALFASLVMISVPTLASAKEKKSADNTTNIDVTPNQGGVTQEELAAIYVLSELCPSYGFKKDPAYQAGYSELVKENMPGIQNPVHALEIRAKQKDFKPFLIQAREDAKRAGETQNKEICKEITTLSKGS